MKTILLAGAIAILTGLTSYAQVSQGQVFGIVTDTTGAGIPGAQVTLENQLTGITQAAVTRDGGEFTFTYLASGVFRVTVTREGFQTAVVPDIQVQVGEKKRVNLVLNVGEMSVEVEVAGATAQINTDNSAISVTLSRKEVANLPLNGRDFSQLATLQPGVSFAGTQCASILTTCGQFVRVGGTSFAGVNYSIDGVDNRSNFFAGPATNPSVDSIQEFRIEKLLAPAEFGRGGAQLIVATKSGSNQFYGGAWEYHRNFALNAGNYYTHKPDQLIRNQFGADIGGPILRNKLFFYVNWESQRQDSTFQGEATVFTEKMRTGDFSELLPQFVVRDPFTGQPFPNNVIPAERLNPYMVDLMESFMPRPLREGVVNNWTSEAITKTDWDQFSPRVDWQLTQKDRLFTRTSIKPRRGVAPPLSPAWLGQTEDLAFYNVGVGWTRIWRSNLITETRFGWHREKYSTDTQQPATPPRMSIAGVSPDPIDHYPILFFSNFSSIGQPGNNLTFDFKDFEIAQSVSLVKGNHLLKVGVSSQHHRAGTPFAYTATSWPFLYFFNTYSGLDAADFLLGIPTQGLGYLASLPKQQVYANQAVFVQDDWKVTSNLTLNYGLRYELPHQIREANDIWANFDPSLGKIVVAGDRVQTDAGFPVSLLFGAYGQYVVPASESSLPRRTLVYGDHTNFAPRFGFAWRPFGGTRTAIRGGYGIYYVRPFGENANNQPFSIPYAGNLLTFNTTPTPTLFADNFFRAGGTFPAPSAALRGPEMRTPSVQQLSLAITHEFPGGIIGEANFQDQHNIREESTWNANQARIGPGPIASRRPWPEFASVWGVFNEGRSRYHALELIARRAALHYTFQVSYTRAKRMGDVIIDIYNRRQFWGPTGYRPHELKLHFVADLPFGKDRRWLNRGGVTDAVFGGWTVSGVSTPYASGTPFTVGWSGDTANIGVFSVRADRTCDGKLSNRTVQKWFDTSCFGPPAAGTVGNAGTGILFGPSFFSADLSISKRFAVQQKMNVQFRAEMFNVFNHPNLGSPRAIANGFAFGEITSVLHDPRVVQLALRVSF